MSDIQDSIQQLSNNGEELYAKVCIVTNVDANAKSCDVQPIDGTAALFDVPFQADIAKEGFCLYPKKESHVLVVFLDKHNAQVCNVSEVDKVEYVQNGLSFLMDGTDGKLHIGNDKTDLLQILTDFIGIIKALKVFTPQGVSGVPVPDAIAKLDKLEKDFKQLLK